MRMRSLIPGHSRTSLRQTASGQVREPPSFFSRPPALPQLSCHSRATSKGRSQYTADNHGHIYAIDGLVVLDGPARTHHVNMPDKDEVLRYGEPAVGGSRRPSSAGNDPVPVHATGSLPTGKRAVQRHDPDGGADRSGGSGCTGPAHRGLLVQSPRRRL